MLYRTRAYMLRQVDTEDGTQYFIDFKDGQGVLHELNVSYDFFMAFRRLELDNRKLENWDYRHREFNEVWDETLNRRALRLPKNVDDLIIEEDSTRQSMLYQKSRSGIFCSITNTITLIMRLGKWNIADRRR